MMWYTAVQGIPPKLQFALFCILHGHSFQACRAPCSLVVRFGFGPVPSPCFGLLHRTSTVRSALPGRSCALAAPGRLARGIGGHFGRLSHVEHSLGRTTPASCCRVASPIFQRLRVPIRPAIPVGIRCAVGAAHPGPHAMGSAGHVAYWGHAGWVVASGRCGGVPRAHLSLVMSLFK